MSLITVEIYEDMNEPRIWHQHCEVSRVPLVDEYIIIDGITHCVMAVFHQADADAGKPVALVLVK